VPDFTYHPFFKPLLFRLPPETGRRLTLGLLRLQAETAVGRRIFGWFGHGFPPPELAVDLFGVRFPGPVGLGPGIDIECSAPSVLQLLGFGFVVAGPAGLDAVPPSAGTQPLRLEGSLALVRGAGSAGPGVAELCWRLRSIPDLRIPVGIALRGDRLDDAVAQADSDARFFTVPGTVASSVDQLRRLRERTRRPLLLRTSPDWSSDQLDRAVGAAMEAGWNGCVATAGAHSPLVPEGEIDEPTLFERSRTAVRRISARGVDVIGAGGIFTPEAALAMLDAGAKLVELGTGLVFAGPGLPGRIVHALKHPSPAPPPQPAGRPSPGLGLGPLLTAFTGFILASSGLFALLLAATVKLLPNDIAYLGMTVAQLCERNQCRIVHFMAHDRVAFGGSILSVGILYLWLGLGPLRRGEPWSWWTLLISGTAGFASFLTYLGTGYMDTWHGWATLALLPCFGVGLLAAFPRLRGSRNPSCLLRSGARAWLWSPGGMGRALLLFTALGMVLGGGIIMSVGVTRVFVPQDLEFMGVTVGELRALNPRLIPLIAHDRAGFGGGLVSTGLAILASTWCGLRPGARGLWWSFLAAGLIGFATSIGIHPLVGYTSFIHLLPAYIGTAAFLLGMGKLYGPLCRADEGSRCFPDF
jgi:dihydroorotate dehydrogenase